jgi:hypothetical protein
MSDLAKVTSKLSDPLEEVRERAAQNIATKIEAGLVRGERQTGTVYKLSRRETLFFHSVDRNGKDQLWIAGFYARILEWIANDWNTPTAFWKLLHFCCEAQAGRKYFLDQGLGVLMKKKTGLDQTDRCLHEVLLMLDDFENQSRNNEAAGDNDASTASSSLVSSTSFPLHLAETSVPRHLLRHQESVSVESTVSKPLTPVTRNYFKRRVQFASSSRDESSTTAPWSAAERITFAWVPLEQHDRDVLNRILDDLRSCDAILAALEELRYKTFKDFPAEVFLQRPDIFHTLLELHTFNPDLRLQAAACECLIFLTEKLLSRRKYHLEMGNGNKQQQGTPLGKDASFIGVVHDESENLRERQVDLSDFCLLVLSGAATVFRGIDHLRLVRVTSKLLKTSSQLAHDIGLPSAWKSSTSTSAFVQEILRDILSGTRFTIFC